MFEHGPALRELLTANLASHPLSTIAVDDRRRAAVAIVVVDSETDGPDSTAVTAGLNMGDVPGDVTGFDGRVQGVGRLGCVPAVRMSIASDSRSGPISRSAAKSAASAIALMRSS